MTAEPISTLHHLQDLRDELATVNDTFDQVEEELASVTLEYEDFMGSYEEGLWTAHVNDGAKFPPEAVRTRMAHRAMPPELLGKYMGLVSQRKRAQERLRALKSQLSAQQSIMNGLRTESNGFSGKANL